MKTLEHYQLVDGYAHFKPVAKLSLENAIQLVSRAVVFTREQQIEKLLVDTTYLSGFRRPDTIDRFKIGQELALAAQSAVRLALVVKPELIDPQRFGLMVARNRGLTGDIFNNESEARDWLLDAKTK